MGLTKQQQKVIDAVLDPSEPLIKIKAIAGAGKTHTLVEAAKAYKPMSGIYIAYNKAIADEATQKFKGTNVKCSTIHSLAYAATVWEYGLKVGYYGVRNVVGTHPSGKDLTFKEKSEIVKHITKFCLSDHLTPNAYIKAIKMDSSTADIFEDQLNMMSDGTLTCPHDFYLKLYHVLMASGDIPIPKVDLLLVDECGDINMLTLAIFKLIESPKKLAVGDPMQNIYSFNETINAFIEMADEGLEVNLTESFRVHSHIAARIEAFVKQTVDTTFQFKGNMYASGLPELETYAYIARTNGGLLAEMFTLMESGRQFHTTRRIDTILEFPLIIANINSGTPIDGYKYKHLEKLRKEWEKSSRLQASYKTALAYIRSKVRDDVEFDTAYKVVIKHGPKDLNTLAKYARECAKQDCALTLTTAHSSKGLEFSSVTIAPDLNETVAKTLLEISDIKTMNPKSPMIYKLSEELRLAYVAASRAICELNNATFLPKGLVL